MGGPQAGALRTRSLVKTEAFWTLVIVIVVPFGWLVPLARMAYTRSPSRERLPRNLRALQRDVGLTTAWRCFTTLAVGRASACEKPRAYSA